MSRPLCPRCQRPRRACLCQWIRPTANKVELVILQHPRERGYAKNTAALLALSLERMHCHVGEHWPEAELEQRIGGLEGSWLLYPDTPDLPTPPAPGAAALERPRLVLLDATWRKSRRMLYRNPLLQQLPRLALTQEAPSRYRLRRARRPGQLSTLEAACRALAQLEGERVDYAPLLAAFDGFNDQHLAFRPGPPSSF